MHALARKCRLVTGVKCFVKPAPGIIAPICAAAANRTNGSSGYRHGALSPARQSTLEWRQQRDARHNSAGSLTSSR